MLLLLAGCATGTGATKPEMVRVRLGLAQQLVDRGEWAGALDAIEGARQSAPADPDVLTLRAVILREQGLLDESEGDLREALRVAPGSAHAHSALAVLYERQHKPQDAEGEHRRALELAPGNARYLNNLGYALLVHGKHREAMGVLLQAVRASPMSPRARNNLGFAYAATGDFARAGQQFAFAGSPSEAKFNLAVAYERTGNLAQAEDHYRAALRLDPGMRRAQEGLDRLAARRAPVAPIAAAPALSDLAKRHNPAPTVGGSP
jgi:Tfp pilus assembly protein PilF